MLSRFVVLFEVLFPRMPLGAMVTETDVASAAMLFSLLSFLLSWILPSMRSAHGSFPDIVGRLPLSMAPQLFCLCLPVLSFPCRLLAPISCAPVRSPGGVLRPCWLHSVLRRLIGTRPPRPAGPSRLVATNDGSAPGRVGWGNRGQGGGGGVYLAPSDPDFGCGPVFIVAEWRASRAPESRLIELRARRLPFSRGR